MLEWLESSFGNQTALIIYYGLIFLCVLVGFFVLRWLWKLINGGTYLHADRNRKQRLSIIDATAVDNRRRLVLVRRDNKEHLVLIGGMNDVLIESDIPVIDDLKTPKTEKVPAKQKKIADKPPVAESIPETKVAVEVMGAAVGAGAAVAATAHPKAAETTQTSPVPNQQTAVDTQNEIISAARRNNAGATVPSASPVAPTPKPVESPVVQAQPMQQRAEPSFTEAPALKPETPDEIVSMAPTSSFDRKVPNVQADHKLEEVSINDEDDVIIEIEDEMQELLNQLTDEAKAS